MHCMYFVKDQRLCPSFFLFLPLLLHSPPSLLIFLFFFFLLLFLHLPSLASFSMCCIRLRCWRSWPSTNPGFFQTLVKYVYLLHLLFCLQSSLFFNFQIFLQFSPSSYSLSSFFYFSPALSTTLHILLPLFFNLHFFFFTSPPPLILLLYSSSALSSTSLLFFSLHLDSSSFSFYSTSSSRCFPNHPVQPFKANKLLLHSTRWPVTFSPSKQQPHWCLCLRKSLAYLQFSLTFFYQHIIVVYDCLQVTDIILTT